MNQIVHIKNLQKVFPKGNICIAENISLDIKEGEIFTILGKSGSGKTTFLRMIAGLETPDDGEISIDNNIVFSKNTEARNRVNTIYMVGFFIGGAAGTSFGSLAWNYFGWTGVSIVGLVFSGIILIVQLLTNKKTI